MSDRGFGIVNYFRKRSPTRVLGKKFVSFTNSQIIVSTLDSIYAGQPFGLNAQRFYSPKNDINLTQYLHNENK